MENSKNYTLKQVEEEEKLLEQNFKQFDFDQSGFIDVHELRVLLSSIENREVTLVECEEYLKFISTDKDNKIDLQEFRDWWFCGKLKPEPEKPL